MSLDEDIEIINLPEEGRFKIVQLLVDGRPVMVCGSTDLLHKDILRAYLISMGIDVPKLQDVELTPSHGKRYRVYGMGEAEINQDTRFFQLF